MANQAQNNPQEGPKQAPGATETPPQWVGSHPDLQGLKKALLIDPENRTFTQVGTTGDTKGPQGLYDLLGVDLVTRIDLGSGYSLWLDDEGLLKDWDEQYFCLTPFYPEPLAGRLLLVKERDMGDGDFEAVDHTLSPETIDFLQYATRWLDPRTVEVSAPSITTMDEHGNASTEYMGGDGTGKLTYQHQG